MDSQDQNEMIFKKLNYNISANCKPSFTPNEDNELFFASDNKLLQYNYNTSFVTGKYKISSTKKVEKFLIVEDKKVFCLLKGNTNDMEMEFVEYSLETKAVTKSYTFTGEENEKIQNFAHSAQLDTFILVTNLGKILYIKEKEGNFFLSKQSATIHSENTSKARKAVAKPNKKQILFTEVNSAGKVAIFPFENKLILHNLINSQSFTIEFIKPLSCGLFLSDDTAVVGDISGKLHFISNLNHKDNKFSIATKHWHSHKVNTIESDRNGDYLYSAGKEGVIVIWNLKTEEKSFLPRLNAEIHNLKLSGNSQYLTAVCADNSIKTVDLFNFKIFNEHSGLSLNTNAGERNIKQFNIKGENYLIFFNESIGKFQIFSINSGRILSSNYVFNKNFVSNTEREEINCRRLKNVEIEKGKFEYLVTYEEIADEKDANFLISYLKFWKLTSNNFKRDFTIELICTAENPHGNEKVSQIEFSEGKCVTYSKSHFKAWERIDVNANSNFVCGFVGAYKKEICKSLHGVFNREENSVYAIHNSKYLIKWDLNRGEIEKIFVIDNQNMNQFKMVLENDHIFIYTENKILNFSISDWEIKWEENFENFNVRNLIKTKERIYLSLSKKELLDEYIIYSLNTKNDIKLEVQDCFYLRKKNLIYLSIWKNLNSLVLVNSHFDVIVTKKNSLLGIKEQKRSEVNLSEEEEMKEDLFQNKNKKREIK